MLAYRIFLQTTRDDLVFRHKGFIVYANNVNPFLPHRIQAGIFTALCIPHFVTSPWKQTILPVARLQKSSLLLFHRNVYMGKLA